MSPEPPTPPATVPDSREMFQLMVESATDFAIFAFAEDGTVTSWNAGAERLLGYEAGEILGRSADVIFTPDDRHAGVPKRRGAKQVLKVVRRTNAGTYGVMAHAFGARVLRCRSGVAKVS